MMAKLTLAVIGASNLLAAFGAGFYMVTVDELTVLPSLLVAAGALGGFLAACAIEALDDPRSNVTELDKTPFHHRADTPTERQGHA
jgi:hypothetical protein